MLRNIGQFRHIVILERNTPAADTATNQPVESWATATADIPCHIETVSGGEIRRGMQMQATTTHLVRMHHPNGAFTVDEKDRLDHSGVKLNVVSAIDRDGMLSELFIQCKANT